MPSDFEAPLAQLETEEIRLRLRIEILREAAIATHTMGNELSDMFVADVADSYEQLSQIEI